MQQAGTSLLRAFKEDIGVLKNMFPYPLYSVPVALFLLCLSIFSGCATNPATKKIEFMTVSEAKEFKIGQGVDKQVREEMGGYLELPELRSAVKETG